jgi:dihydroxyacetone kinase
MLDALDPFAKTLENEIGKKTLQESVITAVDAAERGVALTAQMTPRLGRSSYLGDRVLGYPDPGAKAIAIWLRAVADALFLT